MFKNVMKLFVVATMALSIAACGGNEKKKSDKVDAKDIEVVSVVGKEVEGVKVNMIPDNALVALRITPEALWNKVLYNLDTENYDFVRSMIRQLSEGAPILNNLGSLGIDLMEPVVASVAFEIKDVEPEMEGAFEACLVASLDDREKFVKNLDKLVEMLDEEDALKVTKKDYDESYAHYMIFSDEEGAFDLGVFANAAVLRVTYDPSSDFKNMAKSMAKLFANGGPAKTEGLDKFYKSEADAALWIDFDNSMKSLKPAFDMADDDVAKQLEALIPLCKGASLVSELDFYYGATSLEFSVYGSDKLKEQALKYNKPASSKYFSYLPASSAVVLNVALKDFPGLVEELSKTNEELADAFESLEELGFDEELYAGFPGQITFALDGYEFGESEIPHFVLVMECQRNVWNFLESYLKEYADLVASDMYCIEDQLYVGYNHGVIMAMDAETLYRSQSGTEDSFADTELAGEIRKGGMLVNLAALPYSALSELAESIDSSMSAYDLLDWVSSVVLTNSEDFMSATLTVNMRDQDHNILSKILDEVISSVNDSY